MEIINITQRSDEWHAWRRGKIGASDASVIMGVSPWKTPYQLWLEKLGKWSPEVTSAMQRGNDLEAEAREAFEEYMEEAVYPACVEHEDHPDIIASLDGLSFNQDFAVEIKCPGEKNHALAKNGSIPDHYRPQLQHQMMVTGFEEIYYWSYDGQDGVLLKEKRDDDYIEKLLKKEKEFLGFIRRMEPPPLTDKDVILRKDKEWLENASVYKELLLQQKALEEKLSETRSRLEELSQGTSCRGGGIALRHGIRKGTIDYGAIPGLKNMNLEYFRKAPSKTLTIKEEKEIL